MTPTQFGGAALVGATVLVSGAALAASGDPDSTSRNVVAHRVNPHAPSIDGRLDDPCWQHAQPVSGFVQRDPDEGQPARQQTEARVLYDDAAIYVGVTAFDTEPEKIKRLLTRRDEDSESDWISVYIDPFHDRRTGYSFSLNASGVKQDALISNDAQFDASWDGVWDGIVAHSSQGWSAEFRIPFTQIRFPVADAQTWGFSVSRYLSRANETSANFFWAKSRTGLMSQQGHLTGIAGVHPARLFEVVPYVVAIGSRTQNDAGTDISGDGRAGFDLTYGLASAYTLNGTVHPDFGQVEADPAVLNLGPYETFFPEKRPFFLEGSGLFQPATVGTDGGPGFYQFYSRRIGREPITAAGKITGKSTRGTSVAFLSALTRPDGGPNGDYEVVRVQQDVFGNGSSLGFMGTRASRPDRASASHTMGVDWLLKTPDSRYQFAGRGIGTWAPIDDATRFGSVVSLEAWKLGGAHSRVNLLYRRFSSTARLNDLGYMQRSDKERAFGWMQWRHDKPGKIFRSYRVNVSTNHEWNTAGVRLSSEVDANVNSMLTNNWFVGGGGGFGFASFDDRETRGAWTTLTPDGHWQWFNVNTDGRKAVSLGGNVSQWHNAGGSHGLSVGMWVDWRPRTNVSIGFYPSYSHDDINAQWVENLDDTTSVFGSLDSRVLDLTLRANVTLSPTLSVQLYTQPFVASGRYGSFARLARPMAYAFDPIAYDGAPNFDDRSLRGTVVMRWEYSPGSLVYVVWSENRYADEDARDGAFVPLRDVGHALTAPGEGQIQVKLSYLLGL